MTRTALITAILVPAIAFACGHADARSQRERCAGILHQDEHELWFGGARGEDEGICIVSKSQVSNVLKICSAGKYCRVVGSTEPCKDSGECVTIKNIVSVATRKAIHRKKLNDPRDYRNRRGPAHGPHPQLH